MDTLTTKKSTDLELSSITFYLTGDLQVHITDKEQIKRWDEWSSKSQPNGWIILRESPTKRVTIFYNHVVLVERNFTDPHAF
jgi:hypothetical protein